MNTYSQIHGTRINEILVQAAMGVSAVTGYKYPLSDMVLSLSDFSTKLPDYPYYIAIREMGTESGCKDYCLERCQTLGYPIIIAKIERNKSIDYDMTIMFTSDPRGDNLSMRMEFDSL